MMKKISDHNVKQFSSGIDVSLEELISVRNQLIHNPLPCKKEVRGTFSGQKIAKIRGRGIEFDATREYQPGDDIRRMAWRVTARNLKPHIKMYNEERERPIWLGVDLSPSLYFGTRCMFKSVCSIKQAAFLGWSYLSKRDRIGTVIATPHKTLLFRPQPSEREFLAILKSLSVVSKERPEFTEKNCLHHLLTSLQQQVRSGNLLFILSDFLQFDNNNQKLISHLAQRAQVTLIFVYDPFEAEPPPPYPYIVTNGQHSVVFNMDQVQDRTRYQQQFQLKLNDVTEFARKQNISLKILRTDQSQEWLMKR